LGKGYRGDWPNSMRVVLPRKKGPVKCAILHGAAPKRAGLLFEFEAAFGRRPQGFGL
jgi:hypothetical protein